jgi:ABC-type transport system involved in multi-copper enzyme maturation permease subunit
MRAISIIAKDTLLELSKRKVLLAVLIAVALTVIFFILAIVIEPFIVQKMVARLTSSNPNASPEQIAAIAKQFNSQGYNLLVSIFSFIIDVLGTLLAILMFATFLPSEIERGSIKFIISKPVSRLEVVLGKWAGGAIVLLCYSAGTALLLVIASFYLTGSLTPEALLALPYLFCKLLIRGSVAMCLSVAMKPILAGVLAFFISGDIFAFFAWFAGESAVRYGLVAISFLLPNYSIFPLHSFRNSLFQAMGAHVPELGILTILACCGYALLYVAAMLFLTMKQFEKKDLT